ncbi:response regulator [Vibrio campbellii]|uniref:EAL domain-containing response regulator n=1 Tax=Vibrio campbellii TaxID=680 RepID=UPI00215CB61D|nr:response regulator [Vibrio campbellii]MCR9907575.1 response regulator [Vibrio campbellii]
MMYKSVLVVDDVELSREIIKSAVLAASDYAKITCVENAYSAINKIRSKKYDLVIMDIMMPNGDGFELLSMISQLAVSTKIIVISSLDRAVIDSMPQIGKLYDLHIFKALEKPINSMNVTELVAEVFSQEDDEREHIKRFAHDVNIFDFPIGAYYQPQVSSNSNEIIGVDISGNWFNNGDGHWLYTHLLPEIGTLTSKKLFNQIVIGKFLQDYKEHFKELANRLYFTLHIHHEFIDDSFIYSCLMELVKFNSKHHFSLYVDHDDAIEVDSATRIQQLESLLSNGISIILGSDKLTAERVLSASKLPIRELKLSVHNNSKLCLNDDTDLLLNISNASKQNNLSVMLDGVEDVALSQLAASKGLAKQQGILFGGPVNAETLTKALIKQNRGIPEGEV